MKLSNKVYDVLKWIALIALPALQVALVTLGKIWNLPAMVPTAATVGVLATLIGVCIGVSTFSYKTDEASKADKPQ